MKRFDKEDGAMIPYATGDWVLHDDAEAAIAAAVAAERERCAKVLRGLSNQDFNGDCEQALLTAEDQIRKGTDSHEATKESQ